MTTSEKYITPGPPGMLVSVSPVPGSVHIFACTHSVLKGGGREKRDTFSGRMAPVAGGFNHLHTWRGRGAQGQTANFTCTTPGGGKCFRKRLVFNIDILIDSERQRRERTRLSGGGGDAMRVGYAKVRSGDRCTAHRVHTCEM